jgi:hypothetical protein
MQNWPLTFVPHVGQKFGFGLAASGAGAAGAGSGAGAGAGGGGVGSGGGIGMDGLSYWALSGSSEVVAANIDGMTGS